MPRVRQAALYMSSVHECSRETSKFTATAKKWSFRIPAQSYSTTIMTAAQRIVTYIASEAAFISRTPIFRIARTEQDL